MPKLTPGNRLYLYQLLRREIGVGRQTLLSRVEEVLAADGLEAEDLGYASVREALEGLDGMVKLTAFKKGNVYATLLPNEEWDRILAEPEGPTAQQKAAAKGKPWKHRSKAKTLRPAKPHRRREKAVPKQPGEPQPAPEEASAPRQAETAQPEPTTVTAPAADVPPTAEGTLQPKVDTAQPEPPEAEATPSPQTEAEPAQATPAEMAGQPGETTPPERAVTPADEPEDGGTPVEATPLERPDEHATSPVPTPHIRLTVTYDPYAGIERDLAATERNLSEAVLETARAEAHAASTDTTPIQDMPQQQEASTPTSPQQAPAQPEAPQATAPQEEPTHQEQPTPVPPQPEPVYQLLNPAEERAVEPVPVLVGLPQDFATEVYVPNGPLSLLYQIMPPSQSPTAELAEDWQVARSTRSYEGTRNLVSFPLRVAHSDGTPVTATIRRTTRPASGRHWALVAVDGGDGTTPPADEPGPEGLPERGLAVERLLARSVELGAWTTALEALSSVAAPEQWDIPGKPGEHGALRGYLALTFRAVLEQGLLAMTPDGSFAAFDTGLLSPLSEHVYACLEAQTEGAPWRLAGFSTTGEGELGSRLAGIDPLPPAPTYLTGFGELFVRPGTTVQLPRKVAESLGEDADDLVGAAVRHSTADYRLVAPAVDVATGDPRLLLPLAPSGGPVATAALSVERAENGALVATAVLDLAQAYVEARVVSRSMPGWLAGALARPPED